MKTLNTKRTTQIAPRKLVLHREVINRLTAEDLRSVRGGQENQCGETSCSSDPLCTKITG